MKYKTFTLLTIFVSFILCYSISSISAQTETDEPIQDVSKAQILSGYWKNTTTTTDTYELYWFEENGHFTWISSRQENTNLIGASGYWEYDDGTLQLTTTTILECFPKQDSHLDEYSFTTLEQEKLFTRTYDIKLMNSKPDTTDSVPSRFVLDEQTFQRIQPNKNDTYPKQLESIRNQNIFFWKHTSEPSKNETLQIVIASSYSPSSKRIDAIISKSLSLIL